MNQQWYTTWVIFSKEVIDNARDKRSIITILISVLAAPIFYIAMITFIENKTSEKLNPLANKAIELPIIGANNAPNLIKWLEKHNITPQIKEETEDYRDALKKREYLMILKIDTQYKKAIEQGHTAPLLIIHDSTTSGLDKIAFKVVQQAIHSYSQQLSVLRLMSRGINPNIVRPIQINRSDVANANLKGIQLLSMLPYFLIIFIMTGGMYLAIDTTAGEREKGTLESLLIQPANRTTIVLAKLLATAFFSYSTTVLSIIGLSIAFAYSPSQAIQFSLSLTQIAILCLICLPLCLLLNALMILLASFTKSFKEAQSYLSFSMMIPTLPLIGLMVSSPEPSINNMWIPVLSQALLILEVIKNETVSHYLIGLSFSISSLVAAITVFYAIKLYQKERILG